MKSKINKIIALAIVIINCQLSIINCKAQTIPAGVNFQAIARGATGSVLVSTAIQVRVSILDGSSSGSVLGSYTYQKTTDGYGQFTVAIGTDATIANSGAALSAIDWTAASRWIKVEFQPGTSGGFTLISNSEATASFYSFAAKTAAGLKIAGTNGDVLKHNGTTWVAGTDNTNTYTASNGIDISSNAVSSIASNSYGIFQEKYSSTPPGSATTVNSWVNINLNTTQSSSGTSDITVSGSSITLLPGTYRISGYSGSFINVSSNTGAGVTTRLFSTSTVIEGDRASLYPGTSGDIVIKVKSNLDGIITVGTTTSYTFQRYVDTYNGSNYNNILAGFTGPITTDIVSNIFIQRIK